VVTHHIYLLFPPHLPKREPNPTVKQREKKQRQKKAKEDRGQAQATHGEYRYFKDEYIGEKRKKGGNKRTGRRPTMAETSQSTEDRHGHTRGLLINPKEKKSCTVSWPTQVPSTLSHLLPCAKVLCKFNQGLHDLTLTFTMSLSPQCQLP